MKTIGLLLAGAVCVASGVVQAADSPAQAAYCMEYLRNFVTLVDEPISAPPPSAPPEALATHDALVAQQRQMDANVRAVFGQWRLYALTLDMANMQVSGGFLRGTAQAKSDMAYINSQSAAEANECNKAQAAAPPGVDAASQCVAAQQKAAKTDPMMQGISERIAPCMKGPSL
jgi:hypothetical protein